MAEIHYLHGKPRPIEQFTRIGHNEHRQLETLHASGRLPVKRAVFEATHLPHQLDLLNTLRASRVEIILDTNMAETAEPGRFARMAQTLVWGNKDRPWAPSDFSHGANRDTAAHIAQFAVEHRVDAVLAPTHLLGRDGPLDQWFDIDLKMCNSLRAALDSAGGNEIAIDYLLMIPYGCLLNEAQRRMFVARLAGLPFENLWMRAAGFGRDATPSGFQRYILGLLDFHKLAKPIVADGVGGLAGLGAAAFGSVEPLSFGVTQKERFDPSSWRRPRKESDGGGETKWIYFPPLDRLLKKSQAELLLNTRGARPFLACNTPSCCPVSPDDMLSAHKAHFLAQRNLQLQDLSTVSESRRAQHYIEKHLAEANRQARRAAKLKIGDEKLEETLRKNSERLDNMHRVAEALYKVLPETTRSALPAWRDRQGSGRAQDGRL
jgi:hypothetical protein